MPQQPNDVGEQPTTDMTFDPLVGAVNRSLAVHGEALPADEPVAITCNQTDSPHGAR